METSETPSTQQESHVLLALPEEGISLAFYALLVKMEPLIQKCDSDVLKFFREMGCDWDTNGTLCSTKAMSLQDLDDCFESLYSRGMLCEAAHVDFDVVTATWDILNVYRSSIARHSMMVRLSSATIRLHGPV